MKQTSGANKDRIGHDPNMSPRVVRRRFAKAFPELVKLFGWLNGGYLKGAELAPLIVAYGARIGKPHTRLLLWEIQDVRLMGLPDGRSLEVLICDVLGLSKELTRAEAESAYAALAIIEQQLLSLQS
jgi:hypothetical protein